MLIEVAHGRLTSCYIVANNRGAQRHDAGWLIVTPMGETQRLSNEDQAVSRSQAGVCSASTACSPSPYLVILGIHDAVSIREQDRSNRLATHTVGGSPTSRCIHSVMCSSEDIRVIAAFSASATASSYSSASVPSASVNTDRKCCVTVGQDDSCCCNQPVGQCGASLSRPESHEILLGRLFDYARKTIPAVVQWQLCSAAQVSGRYQRAQEHSSYRITGESLFESLPCIDRRMILVRLIAQNGGQIGNCPKTREEVPSRWHGPAFAIDESREDTDPASDNLACFCITEANDVQRLTALTASLPLGQSSTRCAVADAVIVGRRQVDQHPEKENGYPTGPIRKKETALTMISRQMRFLLLCHRLVNCIGGVLIHLLDKTRSGPCLAVKRPGVPRDPFARMPDVHFQGAQTARLVCSSVPSKTPATVRFAGGTVHSGQGATPVTIDVSYAASAQPGGLRRIGDSRPRPGPGFAKRAITTQLNRAAVPTLSLKTGLARALSVVSNLPAQVMTALVGLPASSKTSAMQTDASAVRGTPGYVACRRDDGKTGAWIAMFWDGAKTDSRLTIPAARLRAASPPNMLRERQSTSRAYQTFGSTWKGNKDISSETSDGPERASVGLEKSQPDPEIFYEGGFNSWPGGPGILNRGLGNSAQRQWTGRGWLVLPVAGFTTCDDVGRWRSQRCLKHEKLILSSDKLSNYCRLVTAYYGQVRSICRYSSRRTPTTALALSCPQPLVLINGSRPQLTFCLVYTWFLVLPLPLIGSEKAQPAESIRDQCRNGMKRVPCNHSVQFLSEKPSDHKTYPARPFEEGRCSILPTKRHTAGFRERFGGIVWDRPQADLRPTWRIITLRLGGGEKRPRVCRDGFIFCDLPWSDDGEWAAKQVVHSKSTTRPGLMQSSVGS
ncbi:uncharacterized protein CLUP02_04071 [Colletotrichum lupini]|uniref:Uncharacterized protein n=1 Tax=Colletotrichum lupini TaxID=145971 RepID=A0A9Q8WCS2_9PEZI|nr:uncharacterized protein CLUP02_04071 [Colletotrichum lupini]UQC78594.1 hypothetical protein CLUP02_04071 [Colletotrichum lupini]